MTVRLQIGNLDAIAYHLDEKGQDNGGIERKALALFLRSVADTLEQQQAKGAESGLTLATLCDMVLGEDAEDRSDDALIRGIGMLQREVGMLQREVERLQHANENIKGQARNWKQLAKFWANQQAPSGQYALLRANRLYLAEAESLRAEVERLREALKRLESSTKDMGVLGLRPLRIEEVREIAFNTLHTNCSYDADKWIEELSDQEFFDLIEGP